MDFDANKIRALIAKYLGIDAERVIDEAHFRNDFDLDSLDQLELLILIEEEFSLSDEAVEQIEHVGDLIGYMEINCLLGDLYAQTFRKSRPDAKTNRRHPISAATRRASSRVSSLAADSLPGSRAFARCCPSRRNTHQFLDDNYARPPFFGPAHF